MNNAQAKAESLFAKCFLKAELEFLHHQPRFIEVTHKIESIVAALDAVEFGGLLIRQTWKRPDYPASSLGVEMVLASESGNSNAQAALVR